MYLKYPAVADDGEIRVCDVIEAPRLRWKEFTFCKNRGHSRFNNFGQVERHDVVISKRFAGDRADVMSTVQPQSELLTRRIVASYGSSV